MVEEDVDELLEYSIDSLECGNPIDGGDKVHT
jgi:hypothetical protein